MGLFIDAQCSRRSHFYSTIGAVMTKKKIGIEELLKRNPQVDREKLSDALALLRELSKDITAIQPYDPSQCSRTGVVPKQQRRRPVRLRTRL